MFDDWVMTATPDSTASAPCSVYQLMKNWCAPSLFHDAGVQARSAPDTQACGIVQ